MPKSQKNQFNLKAWGSTLHFDSGCNTLESPGSTFPYSFRINSTTVSAALPVGMFNIELVQRGYGRARLAMFSLAGPMPPLSGVINNTGSAQFKN